MSFCWLNFIDANDIMAFCKQFENQKFKPITGPLVGLHFDYAMYQSVPSASNNDDPRKGTIEQGKEIF